MLSFDEGELDIVDLSEESSSIARIHLSRIPEAREALITSSGIIAGIRAISCLILCRREGRGSRPSIPLWTPITGDGVGGGKSSGLSGIGLCSGVTGWYVAMR